MIIGFNTFPFVSSIPLHSVDDVVDVGGMETETEM